MAKSKAIIRREYAYALKELRSAQKRAAATVDRAAKEMKRYPGTAETLIDSLQKKLRSEKSAIRDAAERYRRARSEAVRHGVSHPGDKYGGDI